MYNDTKEDYKMRIEVLRYTYEKVWEKFRENIAYTLLPKGSYIHTKVAMCDILDLYDDIKLQDLNMKPFIKT